MNGKELDRDSVLSELKLSRVVFDALNFERTGLKQKNDEELDIGIGVAVEKHTPGHYRVILKVSAERKEEFAARVQVSGFYKVDEDSPIKDDLLNKNAVAILFPYVRSELTLLTSQPSMTPIILPAINIDALINQQNAEAQASNE